MASARIEKIIIEPSGNTLTEQVELMWKQAYIYQCTIETTFNGYRISVEYVGDKDGR
jgi:hypothetical protein